MKAEALGSMSLPSMLLKPLAEADEVSLVLKSK